MTSLSDRTDRDGKNVAVLPCSLAATAADEFVERPMTHLRSLIPLASLVAMASAPALAACPQGDVGGIDMSCPGLWRERNRVYAEHGYCFQTERAIRVFGRGCFPPYGQLSGNDQCYVQAIQRIERDQGCAP